MIILIDDFLIWLIDLPIINYWSINYYILIRKSPKMWNNTQHKFVGKALSLKTPEKYLVHITAFNPV